MDSFGTLTFPPFLPLSVRSPPPFLCCQETRTTNGTGQESFFLPLNPHTHTHTSFYQRGARGRENFLFVCSREGGGERREGKRVFCHRLEIKTFWAANPFPEVGGEQGKKTKLANSDDESANPPLRQTSENSAESSLESFPFPSLHTLYSLAKICLLFCTFPLGIFTPLPSLHL